MITWILRLWPLIESRLPKGAFELKGWMSNYTLWIGTVSFFVSIGLVAFGVVHWAWLLVTFAMHLFLAICISMVLHRYLTHRSFQVAKLLEPVLSFMSVMPLMLSPLYWVPMHIDHHAFSDTDKDPNVTDVKYLFWRYSNGVGTKPKRETMRYLFGIKGLRFCHEYTLLLIGLLAVGLFWVHPFLLLFGYMAPLGIAAWGQGLHQVFAHKNNEPQDHPWWEFVWSTGGEWMHAFHHRHPGAARYGGYLDISYWVIRVIALKGSIRGQHKQEA